MHKIIKGRREREKYVHLRSATPQKAQVYRHTLFNQVNEIRRESTTGASHHWFTSVQNVGMAFIIAANVMVVVVVVVASYCYCSSSASSSSLVRALAIVTTMMTETKTGQVTTVLLIQYTRSHNSHHNRTHVKTLLWNTQLTH